MTHTGHLLAALVFMAGTLLLVAAVEHRQQLAVQLRTPGRAHLVRFAAAAGAAGAGIHLAVAPSHWATAPFYGAFFVVAGTTQLSYAVLVVLRPRRSLLALNGLGSLGLVLLWLLTRTVGVPLGPEAGIREPVGLLDLLSVACELAVVAVAAALVRPREVTREYVDVHVSTRDRYMDVHVS